MVGTGNLFAVEKGLRPNDNYDPLFQKPERDYIAQHNLQLEANKSAKEQQQAKFGQDQKMFGLQAGQSQQDRDLQRYLADQGAQTTRQGNQLQYDASVLPANLKQQRFNTLLPQFNQAFGSITGGGASGGQGASFGTQPQITTGGVFDPGQIQQQVNAGRASNDRQTAGDIRTMKTGVAGRGFGTRSPLAMALEQNFRGMNTAANAATERETRMGAAQTNATHNLASQQAAETQFASRQQEANEREKTRQQALAAWMSSLSSLAG